MSSMIRALAIVAAVLAVGGIARADETESGQNRAKLEEAKRAISSMRESYAYVVRKEDAAKSEHDPVLLNTLHQIANRIADLVNVADHALDDMRVAITSNEPTEAIDAELEKITLAKTKVEQARNEADRSVGIKLLGSSDTDSGLSRSFIDEGSDLTGSGSDDPLNSLSNSNYIPSSYSQPPPASNSRPST
jgi:hypothetical protein